MAWARMAAWGGYETCTHVLAMACGCKDPEFTRSSINSMHNWICEFFGAHNWDFKPAKSEYQVVYRTNPTDAEGTLHKAEQLPALSGNPRDAIKPTDPEKAGRYLGALASPTLKSWERQEKACRASINTWVRAVHRNKTGLVQTVDAHNAVLLPRLEGALCIASFDVSTLNKWSTQCLRTVRLRSGITGVKSLSTSAMRLALGIRGMREHMVLRSGVRAAARLRYRELPSGQTAWLRLRRATQTGSGEQAIRALQLDFPSPLEAFQRRMFRHNRLARAIRDLMRMGVFMAWNGNQNWPSAGVAQHCRPDFHGQPDAGGTDSDSHPNALSPHALHEPLRRLSETNAHLSVRVKAASDGSTDQQGHYRSGAGIALKVEWFKDGRA